MAINRNPREEIEGMIRSRHSYKGKCTARHDALEEVEGRYKMGNPTHQLVEYLDKYTAMFMAYENVNEKIMAHPKVEAGDEDKDYDDYLNAYLDKKADITFILREVKERAAAAAAAAAAPQQAQAGRNPQGAQPQVAKPKVDATKPPILHADADWVLFHKWQPLWNNYVKLVELNLLPRERQVAIL